MTVLRIDLVSDVVCPWCAIGLASLEDGEDARTLLRRADEAMYRAKRAGRDRVADADGAPPGG